MMGSEPCSGAGNRECGVGHGFGEQLEDLGLSRREQQGAPDCVRQVARLTDFGS